MSNRSDRSFNPVATRTRSSSSKRSATSSKRLDDQAPRPPNAFILFRSHVSAESKKRAKEASAGRLTSEHGYGQERDISKIAGVQWKALSDTDRALWTAKAENVKNEHKAKYPDYVYKPAPRASKEGSPPSRRTTSIAKGSPASLPYHPAVSQNGYSAGSSYAQDYDVYYPGHPISSAEAFTAPQAYYPDNFSPQYFGYDGSMSTAGYSRQGSPYEASSGFESSSSGLYPTHQAYGAEPHDDVDYRAWMTPETGLY